MQQMPNIIGLLEDLESPYLRIEQNRCAVVRNRNVTCRRCAEACTSGCIQVEDGRMHLEPERCIGCGTCATICPTGAIQPKQPDDEELYGKAHACLEHCEGEVTFTCENLAEAPFAEDAVVLKCLGRVEETLLMRLARDGAKHVVLFHGDCSVCPHATGLETARLVAGTVNSLLEAWGGDLRVDLDSDPSLAEQPAYSTPAIPDADEAGKGKEHADADQAPDAAAEEMKDGEAVEDEEESLVAKVEADGTLPHVVPQRRTDLLEILQDMAPEDITKEDLVKTRLCGHVLINPEVCASCRVCSIFCPTGALHRFEEGEGEEATFGLLHTPSLCVRCLACQDSCVNQALLVDPKVYIGDLVDGTVYRHTMAPQKVVRTGSHSTVNSLRYLLDCDNIYER